MSLKRKPRTAHDLLAGAADNGPRHAAVIAEAMRRDDLGVGEVWEPEAGGGMRPTAIHARGITSLETAAAEIEEIAANNQHLRQPTSDTPKITMRPS